MTDRYQKRLNTMIARYGSEEAFKEAMASFGAKGGRSSSKNVKYRGFGKKNKK